jgi:hypothetical protein
MVTFLEEHLCEIFPEVIVLESSVGAPWSALVRLFNVLHLSVRLYDIRH